MHTLAEVCSRELGSAFHGRSRPLVMRAFLHLHPSSSLTTFTETANHQQTNDLDDFSKSNLVAAS